MDGFTALEYSTVLLLFGWKEDEVFLWQKGKKRKRKFSEMKIGYVANYPFCFFGKLRVTINKSRRDRIGGNLGELLEYRFQPPTTCLISNYLEWGIFPFSFFLFFF